MSGEKRIARAGTVGAGMILAGLLLAASTLSAGAVVPKTDRREIDIPKIEIEPVNPQVAELANGIRLLVLRNDRLPLVDIVVMVRTGELYEPPGRAGLADMTGRLLRTGGTGKWKSVEVDEKIDAMAAQFRTWIGTESGGVYMNLLSAKLDEGVAILAETLRDPAFEPEKMEITRGQMREEIRRRNDDPERIARRVELGILYGKDHPAARYATFESLDAIRRDDIVHFHHAFFKPNNLWIGMSGNVTAKQARAVVEKYFADWKPEQIVFPPLPARPESAERGMEVYLVRKETEQSTLLAGHLSIRMDDPDRAKLQVGNFILGGSFSTSRLYKRIRHREGLAYYTGSWFRPAHAYDGVFMAVAQTAAKNTGKTLGIMLEEIRRIHDEPVTEEELEIARNSLVNREVFQYEDPEAMVRRMIRLDYYGLPADYYQRTLRQYQTATVEEVHDAMERKIDPDGLKILVVGDDSKFDIPLEDLGHEVQIIDVDAAEGK